MAIGALKPFGVRLVRKDDVGHRTTRYTHDIYIHHQTFCIGIGAIPAWNDLLGLKRIHPVYVVTERAARQTIHTLQRWLQHLCGVDSWIVNAILSRRQVGRTRLF